MIAEISLCFSFKLLHKNITKNFIETYILIHPLGIAYPMGMPQLVNYKPIGWLRFYMLFYIYKGWHCSPSEVGLVKRRE